jgi:hypothetical protein
MMPRVQRMETLSSRPRSSSTMPATITDFSCRKERLQAVC